VRERTAAVNVDIDSLYLYYRIHGLDDADASNIVWERGVTRFAELFDEVGVRATFFVVASDLERWPRAREMAEELVAAGHEIGNHTYTHPYDLIQRSDDEIAREIDEAHRILSEVRGSPVAGFRAPGYHMSDDVYRALVRTGYRYSSSIFPSPPYYLAKLGVMGMMRLVGKTSKAIMGDPRIMIASRFPHHRRSMLEIPITVLPGIRFPIIGTSMTLLGQRGMRLLRPAMRRMNFVNLEFHGIDLCDRDTDGIDLSSQPDLKVNVAEKRATYKATLEDLRDHWEVDTLEALAPRFKGPKAR